jgi:hypothetical protein
MLWELLTSIIPTTIDVLYLLCPKGSRNLTQCWELESGSDGGQQRSEQVFESDCAKRFNWRAPAKEFSAGPCRSLE